MDITRTKGETVNRPDATYTRAQKAAAAQREAERRARTFPKLVAQSRMQHSHAQREIEIMQEIAEDYAAPREPDLDTTS